MWVGIPISVVQIGGSYEPILCAQVLGVLRVARCRSWEGVWEAYLLLEVECSCYPALKARKGFEGMAIAIGKPTKN